MTLDPRLDILPDTQRALWPLLAAVPKHFVLYGGTALALRLGHRTSIDFDFFTSEPIDHDALEAIPWLRTSTTVQHGPSERTVLVDLRGSVKVSFFGSLRFGRIGDPQPTVDGVLRVASVLDLAGTKIKVLLQRTEAKDYRDIAALLQAGVRMEQILAAGRSLFGDVFNPLIAQKALVYFKGGDLETLEQSVRDTLLNEALAQIEVTALPIVSSKLA